MKSDCFYTERCIVIIERIKEARAPYYRPNLPEEESGGVHLDILSLMKQCWAEEPSNRPSFKEIMKTLWSINKGKSVLFWIFDYIRIIR